MRCFISHGIPRAFRPFGNRCSGVDFRPELEVGSDPRAGEGAEGLRCQSGETALRGKELDR